MNTRTLCAVGCRGRMVATALTLGLSVSLVSAQSERPAGRASAVAPSPARAANVAGVGLEAPIADAAGKCGNSSLCDVTLQNCNASQLPCRPWTINRFLSFSLPSNIAGQSTALRVELTSLHHPNPLPPGPPPPDFSAFEGQFRYVNLVASTPNRCCTDSLQCNRTATCNSDADCVGMLVQPPFINTPAPTCRPNLCGDSASFATFYPCAKLGCTPEYRDWDADFEGRIVYVFGDAVVPDSIYNVALLDATCAGNEEECGAASAELSIATARWGNVDGSVAVIPGAQDVGWVVSKIKDAPGSFIEPRALLREATVNPHGTATAQDCSRSIDTCKGFNYGFTISQCP